MNTETNSKELKWKYMGPCSLNHLFLPEKSHTNRYWIDSYKEPFASLIFEYKSAFQMLQLTLLESDLENSREIDCYFQKLEQKFEKITQNFRKD